MEQCKYCNDTFKQLSSHVRGCPTKLSMTPCPHCNKLFKRISAHVYRCPQKPAENGNISNKRTLKEEICDDPETVNKTPCPHCNKLFKRVSMHVNRCKQRPDENGEVSNGKEEGETQKTPCPHCNKMFKKLSAHIYRCPKKPSGKKEISNGEDNRDLKTPERKSRRNGETPNETPCPHCKKMFKQISAHVSRCPEKPEGNGQDYTELRNGKMIKNYSSSSSEEEEEEENIVVAANLTPCRYCNKMFKRVSGHVNRCPQKPREIEEEDDEEEGEVSEYESSEDEEGSEEGLEDEEYAEEDDAEVVTQCPYCKVMSKFIAIHISNCPRRPEINFRETTQYSHQMTNINKISENAVPKQYIDQSGYRTNHHASIPVFKPSPQRAVSEESDHASIRPSNHGDYLTSTTPKSPPNKSTNYSFSTKSYESRESDSNQRKLKRPPIHGNHTVHYEGQFLENGFLEDRSLTDYSEDNSFYRSSESDGSFSYLDGDLKRPPIHKSKSRSSSTKKQQYPTDEEEFFEFRHHSVVRE